MAMLNNLLINNRRWLLAATVITLLTVGALFLGGADAGAATSSAQLMTAGPHAPDGQIYSDDLVVEEGQVFDRDVIVYSGDVRVKRGGRINGNLVVYSGDIKIEDGAVVQGDMSAFSGDVEVEGRVGGNVVAWSGDIELKETASVGGDVSVLSGKVDLDDGAAVSGTIVQGPNFIVRNAIPALKFGPGGFAPGPQAAGDLEHAPEIADGPQPSPLGFWGAFGRFVGRFFGALIFTLFMGALVAGATILRPDWVARIERPARAQTALSFVTGLVTNIALVLLTLVLVITICLWPFPLILLVLLNIVGLAGTSSIVGRYLAGRLQLDVHPAIVSGLGAIALVGLFIPFWSLGGCFRFIAWFGLLLIGAIGTGALIVPWLNQRNQLPEASSARGVVDGEAAPVVRQDPGPVAPVEATVDNPIAVQQPETPPAAPSPAPKNGADDFTRINGIGAVFQQRLNAAGVRTFAQLAAMTPEQIADVIGWPVARVVQGRIVEQARQFADESLQ